MYDTNEDVLVARKSDYQNNNIGDGFFLIPKDEWFCEDDGLNSFHLFLTNVDNNRISLFLTSEGNPVIFRELPFAENGRYPPTQNGDIRSLFMLFTLMAMQN